RERFSRDLHDVVGHTMAVISLQAGVASEAVGIDDHAATEALERIRTASNQSLRELRSMMEILRSPTDRHETHRVQSLSAIQDLIDAAKRSEEHTSVLQSRFEVLCRLLLEIK